MGKRQFVQLAQTLENVDDRNINGWLMSEKLDGIRLIWDGGISRGLVAKDVPYANVERDARLVSGDGQNYLATGLWSRNAKVIRCPEWFLDKLPPIILDGEIYAGRGRWEVTSSITKQLVPNEVDWQQITYQVFDSPPLDVLLSDGAIETEIFTKKINADIRQWAIDQAQKLGVKVGPSDRAFEYVIKWLKKQEIENDCIKIAEQIQLPYDIATCSGIINQRMAEVIAANGEGLMFRNNFSHWAPERSHNLLKLKKWHDAEAEVVGYTFGKETKKGSRNLGRLGALIVKWNGETFECSGFKDEERTLKIVNDERAAYELGCTMAGKDAPLYVDSKLFPRGSMITFRYRELTAKGIPKSANYRRKA